MSARITATLLVLCGFLLAGCGTLVEDDLLVFKTASPNVSVGFRLLPAPEAVPEAEVTPERNDDQCLIKGNVSSTGERIFHMPGGAYYERTWIDPARGDMWLCSEAAALDAGFRKSTR